MNVSIASGVHGTPWRGFTDVRSAVRTSDSSCVEIKARIQAGLQRARRQGQRLGRRRERIALGPYSACAACPFARPRRRSAYRHRVSTPSV
jgi:hypothetical protein